ncbi:hypothetical protein KJ909_00830 [Patescibacteria group bacterium]|nr:hypothetical protein [Patescibacteria group bacterium]
MHIHILGIAGTMTTPLACFLQSQGHQVTGSDQKKIYPPISPLLKKSKIKINQTPISPRLDLLIVGSSYQSFTQTKKEFLQAKKLHLPYISATKYIAQNVAQKKSILVAGTYGKSTITALIIWILKKAKLNPSYMLGAQAINHFPSFFISSSPWSVIEADESINGLDKKAKFLYYPLKYLVLTSADWEHKDSYSTASKNLLAFKKLIKKIPPNGLLVYNSQDKNLKKIINLCRAPVIAYQSKSDLPCQLLGDYNQANISAAVTLCQQLNIDPKIIKNAVGSFLGLKRRLEIIKKTKSDIVVIDDFAQSATRIKKALESVKKSFPRHSIKVFLEPHASFFQDKKGLNHLGQALKLAKEVVLFKIKYNSKIKSKHQATASDFKKEIGNKFLYLPLSSQIKKHYHQTLKKHQVLLHFSSGGHDGLKLLKSLCQDIS